MKPTEAAALLTIAAAYDNRRPDADQAKAWALVLEGMRFEDCREAIVKHYRKSRDWLMPSDVITGANGIRSERLLRFGPVPPPQHLADKPLEEIAWMRRVRELIADGAIKNINEVDENGEIIARRPPEIEGGAA